MREASPLEQAENKYLERKIIEAFEKDGSGISLGRTDIETGSWINTRAGNILVRETAEVATENWQHCVEFFKAKLTEYKEIHTPGMDELYLSAFDYAYEKLYNNEEYFDCEIIAEALLDIESIE